ncbi:hypothetical protein F5148DRAFT_1295705 [Russula earlei]|uniref:Uncharacterized protein n=1 Tax=Russula earlei TaxID=71964 RepID=A0ACC0TQL0_9AGAM|nr:hypothetical protein F5148DRAFT_1295705 [Russula earlei]
MAATHDKQPIAKLVKDCRAAKGYTQQELADLTHISLRSVQRIENGEVQPRLYTIRVLAEHLGFADQLGVPEEVLEEATPVPLPVAKGKYPLNTTQKIILSVGIALVVFLSTAAYIAQSAHFPETGFEWLVLLACITAGYMILLFRIWK